jgi:hypothetical protein
MFNKTQAQAVMCAINMLKYGVFLKIFLMSDCDLERVL